MFNRCRESFYELSMGLITRRVFLEKMEKKKKKEKEMAGNGTKDPSAINGV